MKRSLRAALTAAAIAGLYAGALTSSAFAQAQPGTPAPKEQKDKASCSSKDGCKAKESCKGKDGCKAKDSCKAKESCKGKDGCGAKDKPKPKNA